MGGKVVLAYSGGLDTSVAIKWIKEKYDLDVVTLTVDVGANDRDLGTVRERALEIGAVKALVRDVKDDFVDYFVWPPLQAGRALRGQVSAGDRPGRPLIAKHHGPGRPRARLHGRRARLHRQGQRPGPLRRHLPDASPPT